MILKNKPIMVSHFDNTPLDNKLTSSVDSFDLIDYYYKLLEWFDSLPNYDYSELKQALCYNKHKAYTSTEIILLIDFHIKTLIEQYNNHKEKCLEETQLKNQLLNTVKEKESTILELKTKLIKLKNEVNDFQSSQFANTLKTIEEILLNNQVSADRQIIVYKEQYKELADKYNELNEILSQLLEVEEYNKKSIFKKSHNYIPVYLNKSPINIEIDDNKIKSILRLQDFIEIQGIQFDKSFVIEAIKTYNFNYITLDSLENNNKFNNVNSIYYSDYNNELTINSNSYNLNLSLNKFVGYTHIKNEIKIYLIDSIITMEYKQK